MDRTMFQRLLLQDLGGFGAGVSLKVAGTAASHLIIQPYPQVASGLYTRQGL